MEQRYVIRRTQKKGNCIQFRLKRKKRRNLITDTISKNGDYKQVYNFKNRK